MAHFWENTVAVSTKQHYDINKSSFMTIDIKSIYFSIEMNENYIFNTSINYIMLSPSVLSLV